MLKRIDHSRQISKLLNWLSNSLSQQRGLPVIAGIALVLVGFLFQVAGVYSTSRLIDLLGVVTHNLGVLIALGGLLLSTPLGK